MGIRLPSHKIARRLIELAGRPICAPSANKFAHISPTSSVHVFNDLYDQDVTILDGEETNHGIESTVIKLVKEGDKRQVYILRHGSVSAQKIRSTIKSSEKFKDIEIFEKDVEKCEAKTKAAEAPGQLLKHYCPNVSTYLLEFSQERFAESNTEISKFNESIIIDFGGAFINLKSISLNYYDLSIEGGIEEAMRNLYAT